MRRFEALLCLMMASAGAAAQSASPASVCGTPEAVLERYVDAVGGESAVSRLNSLEIAARAEEPHTFNPQSTAHYKYWFKWKSPNRVAAHWHYLLSPGTGLFDGDHWSNFDGRISHNDDATPKRNLELRARYPYNDSAQWMMYRIAANPIHVATDKRLYTSFDTLPSSPATCVLEANGPSAWIVERRDRLTFDAATGFLKAWKIQVDEPGEISYYEFRFDDYRWSGPVRIPWHIYFDYYKTSITVTRVVPNQPFTDTQFVPKQ